MNYEAFYQKLFEPVIAEYGPLDPKTRFHIVGFDAGGPVNYQVVASPTGGEFVTCVTCELAPRSEQQPSSVGPYELLMTCDDEAWCSTTLTDIAQMSLQAAFDHGHSLDIKPWVGPAFPVQGIVFERYATLSAGSGSFAILRCHGVTRSELEFAQQFSVDQLLDLLRAAGIYPRTSVHRLSSVA